MGVDDSIRTRSRSKEIIKTFKTCFRWAPAIAIVSAGAGNWGGGRG